MRKIFAVLAALAMLAVVTPTASAETVTVNYNGSIGAYTFASGGLALVVCPATCNLDEDPDGNDLGLLDPVNPVGGSRVAAPSGTQYTNAVVNIQDEGFWGSNGGISTCFWNPGGDNICDDDDYGSSPACGGVSLLGSPFASDEVTVWAYTILVEEDLTTCGATFGTISVNFF